MSDEIKQKVGLEGETKAASMSCENGLIPLRLSPAVVELFDELFHVFLPGKFNFLIA
jgi:hypothetical protein